MGGTRASPHPQGLACAHIQRLRHLSLMQLGGADQVVEDLAGSPLLRQLETLAVAMGTLTDIGARIVIRERAAFRHLKLLNLQDNYLSRGLPGISGVAQVVRVGLQNKVGPVRRRPVVNLQR